MAFGICQEEDVDETGEEGVDLTSGIKDTSTPSNIQASTDTIVPNKAPDSDNHKGVIGHSHQAKLSTNSHGSVVTYSAPNLDSELSESPPSSSSPPEFSSTTKLESSSAVINGDSDASTAVAGNIEPEYLARFHSTSNSEGRRKSIKLAEYSQVDTDNIPFSGNNDSFHDDDFALGGPLCLAYSTESNDSLPSPSGFKWKRDPEPLSVDRINFFDFSIDSASKLTKSLADNKHKDTESQNNIYEYHIDGLQSDFCTQFVVSNDFSAFGICNIDLQKTRKNSLYDINNRFCIKPVRTTVNKVLNDTVNCASLSTLFGDIWLNDEVINFMFNLFNLQSHIKAVLNGVKPVKGVGI